jgi:Thiol-disulfide isomerase and thioredoxins
MREILRNNIGGIAAAAIGAIVAIMPGVASAADTACSQPPASIGKFQPATGGKSAPEQGFADEAGKQRSLRDFRGSGLVVNFWATWCPPCIKELPALDASAKALKPKGVIVLALSSDREGAPLVRRFFDKNGIDNLPVSIDAMSGVGHELDVSGLPTTVLFDAEGREVGRVVGAAAWDAPETISFLAACLAPAA